MSCCRAAMLQLIFLTALVLKLALSQPLSTVEHNAIMRFYEATGEQIARNGNFFPSELTKPHDNARRQGAIQQLVLDSTQIRRVQLSLLVE